MERLCLNIPSFRVCHARATFLSLCFVSNSGAVRVKIVPSHIWRPISLSFHIYPFILDVRDPGLFSSLDKKPVCICLDQSPEAPTSVILQPCLSCPHRRRRIFMPAVKAPSVAFGPWSLVNRDTLTTVLMSRLPRAGHKSFAPYDMTSHYSRAPFVRIHTPSFDPPFSGHEFPAYNGYEGESCRL